MVIMHNMKAMNAERQMNVVTADKAKSTEKLSSGYRINRSGDDAAGLSISEKMRHQIRGLDRGSANIEEGVGYCQVADGALNEMHDMLQRMNELCIQAANGTLSKTDRGYIDDEVQVLKSEINRICRTTKFNEEYIFRCEDIIEEKPHDVYQLTFSGKPKDLFIYNTSYDPDDKYAGVVFRGRRYTWDEINPYMYDKTTHQFREGEYGIKADDGTQLTLVCEKGAKLPQVSRKFQTSAGGEGIYVNGDLVPWDKVKISDNKYSFDYHGMTISYTTDTGDSFEDMTLKMTGTVWESTYEAPVEAYSVDANFTYGTNHLFVKNDRIEYYLAKSTNPSSRYMPKYILHAVDINKGGTIPLDLNGDGVVPDPFDGVWLEGTTEAGVPNGQVVYELGADGVTREYCKMTWAEFGFDDTSDWGNLSTDIWSGAGSIKDDPKPVYPPDPAPGTALGTQYFPNYDPYKTFEFDVYDNTTNQREHVSFYFSVINEVSKEQVIETLNHNDTRRSPTTGGAINIANPYGNGLMIYYQPITPHDHAEAEINDSNVKINEHRLTLSLDDEYALGRNYENGQPAYILKNYEQLTYSNGTYSIEYDYDTQRGGGKMTLTGSSSFDASDISALKRNNILHGTISGNKLIPDSSYTNPKIDINLIGGKNEKNRSSLALSYNYDISGFFANGGATIQESESPSGTYVKRNNRYEVYQSWNPNHHDSNGNPLPRYNVDITGPGGQTLQQYFSSTVFPGIANATKIRLHTDNYPTGTLQGVELQQTAMVTRWQTPFQHPHIKVDEDPEEKPEYLRIQCSSNTIDNIWIQKQKLSVYRLGLMNVGTLSQLQATGCIDMVGAAISKISSIRSLFGAEQNRLEHAYEINRNTHENTQGAESKIRDTDMAKEMIRFSNANILEQSGNSMLVQANQANNTVLSLLQ